MSFPKEQESPFNKFVSSVIRLWGTHKLCKFIGQFLAEIANKRWKSSKFTSFRASNSVTIFSQLSTANDATSKWSFNSNHLSQMIQARVKESFLEEGFKTSQKSVIQILPLIIHVRLRRRLLRNSGRVQRTLSISVQKNSENLLNFTRIWIVQCNWAI